jgi:hypothetical protein
MFLKKLELVNKKTLEVVQKMPKWQYYLFFVVIGFVSAWLFFPLFYTVLVGLIFKNTLKFIPKNLKLGLWLVILVLMLCVNAFYLAAYFDLPISHRYLFGENWYYFFYWVVEIAHTTLFATFFYCCYRIIRYDYTPSSNMFVGFYIGTHTLYNACPISFTQNYLLNKAGIQTGINVFWQGLFGEKGEMVRGLFALFCAILFVSAYLQLQKSKLKKEYWFNFWLENKIGKHLLEKKYYEQ